MRRRAAARAVLGIFMACCALASAAPACGAQVPVTSDARTPRSEVLTIGSVSPWVAPEGEFQVRFDPSTTVPPDARFTVTLHEPLEAGDDESLRQAMQDVLDGGSSGRILQTPVTVPFALLGDPTAGATLTIPIRPGRGTRDRVLVPNAGIHPVDLVLTSADGPELWSRTVFLNRLPEPDEERPAPVQVTLVLPVVSAPAVGTDGRGRFTLEERTQLGSVSSLLGAVPEAPLTLAVRPNTLDGLARSEEDWSTRLLNALGTTRSGNVIAELPYTQVDSGSLVASDEDGELQRQILVGAVTVAQRLARRPDASTWVADGSVTDAVVPVLASAGVRTVLAPIESFDLERGVVDGSEEEVDPTRVVTSPVTLASGDGVQALAFDPLVAERLVDDGVEPALRSHQAVSLMMVGWFDAASAAAPPPLATAVLLGPGTDPAVLSSLAATLTSGGPLVADPAKGPAPAARSTDAEQVEVSFRPRTATNLRPTVAAANQTRRRISAYRSMTGTADPDTRLWEELANESVATTLDPGIRAELHRDVRAGIAGKVARIQPPRARRVVVTSDDTVIPLRFRNDLPYEVRLVMRARSPRLQIERPTREIVLQPGENRVDLSVTVKAPGESLLRIELSSPDGGITIPGISVPVRSTAISGVGAALSIVSVLFLCAWWLRTARRRRRQRARAWRTQPATDAPSDQAATDSLTEGG